MRILIVEDEWIIAMHLEEVLQEIGHEVVGVAPTVDAAAKLIEDRRPDALTVDLNLGAGGNGFDVARVAYERWGVRSVFVSGNISESLVTRASEIRPLGYVHKPVESKLLGRALALA